MRNSFLALARAAPLPRRTPRILVALLALLLTTAADKPQQMIAAANPLAAAAGRDILNAGGSAVDAAIAAALVLTLVEPQSSGVGGGAFLIHFDGETGRLAAFDGRETAPASADGDLFLDADGKPLPFWEAVVGGRSVGVPGLFRLFEKTHAMHGRLPWPRLFEPAIDLADQGFPVSKRLHELLARDKHLRTYETARRYFYDAQNEPRPLGHILENKEYAETLRRVAADGADAFYSGPIAEDIVATVRGAAGNPGDMSLTDLAAYEAKERSILCHPYRRWQICGMPPPTSGGVAVLQTLGMLSHFDLAALGPQSPQALHLIAEASRLAFADRALFLADPDFVDVPVKKLLDAGYLAKRAALIMPDRSLGKAEAGLPAQKASMPRQDDPPSTTHLVVADRWGDVVSMTASIESAFGSRLMVRGFLLNNELTDFSFRPEADGRAVANRVEGGKRPRSSMSPTVVLDQEGGFVMAIGSPGGSRIPGYVIKTLVASLDWELDMQAAIAFPNFVNRNGATDLEEATPLAAMAPALEALGHEVRVRPLNSGAHGLWLTANGLEGGADPRREGVVMDD